MAGKGDQGTKVDEASSLVFADNETRQDASSTLITEDILFV
jgi:hypothetical protein